jgi:hypothetical protein
MIKAIVFLSIIGVLFLVAMVLAPAGDATSSHDSQIERSFAADGPPAPVAFLGLLFAPIAPTATPEPPTQRGNCPDTQLAVAKSSTRYRMLRARLKPGATGAARLVFTPADPREDGKSDPFVLCLGAGSPPPALQADCGELKAEGSLPVGRGGGCLAVQGIVEFY